MDPDILIRKIATRLEHTSYDDLTVMERQIVDLLRDSHIVYIAEDDTVRVIPEGWTI